MGRSEFLCGCKIGPRPGYLNNRYMVAGGRVITVEPDPQTGMTIPPKGAIQVCPEHGELPFGHASPMTQGPQGNLVIDWNRVGSGGKVNVQISPEASARRTVLLDLDRQAQQILKDRKRKRNGR